MTQDKQIDNNQQRWLNHNLGGGIPHQCQQRHRVSTSSVPSKDRRKSRLGWKEKLRPDVNMGVPQLMMLLEPKVVWDHVKSFEEPLDKLIEAQHCKRLFFEGYHQKARLAHGVYEGSYWELIKQCEDMQEFLTSMAHAPALMEEPVLKLPDKLEPPKWASFKPELLALPEKPKESRVTLPLFSPPDLLDNPTLVPPVLENVPELLDLGPDEQVPAFREPEKLQIWSFREPTYEEPKKLDLPVEPTKPKFGEPKHGYDWSGDKPFSLPEPQFEVPALVPAPNPAWKQPPLGLPQPPELKGYTRLPPRPNIVIEELNLPPEPQIPDLPELSEAIEPEEVSSLQLPEEIPPPVFYSPPLVTPEWIPPREPKPVGVLSGDAPVIIFDVSGTLHPTRGGLFFPMKACVAELLGPEGEINVAGKSFDVIAFSSTAWSWSAGYEGKLKLLESTHSTYSGRQAGGPYKWRPKSAGPSSTQASLSLQPAEERFLNDAQQWVSSWPEAKGNTNLMSAMLLAAQHSGADSYYLFSDGMADDAGAVMQMLEQKIFAQEHVPAIHTIGFFHNKRADNSGERFLRYISELTGGTYQKYDPNAHQVYQNNTLVPYDDSLDTELVREERRWVETKLRIERRKNKRLGIRESIVSTIRRVREMHYIERVVPTITDHELAMKKAQGFYELQCVDVHERNKHMKEEAIREHEKLQRQAEERRQAAILRSQSEWEEKVRALEERHQEDMTTWEMECSILKEEHEAQIQERNKLVKSWEAKIQELSKNVESGHQREITAYLKKVQRVYADSFFQDVVLGGAVRTASNDLALERARKQHNDEITRIQAENARTLELHKEEVAFKAHQEDEYRKAFESWGSEVERLSKEYEHQVKEATELHEAEVERLRKEWETYKERIDTENAQALEQAERDHRGVVQEVMKRNVQKRWEEEERRKERQSALAENRTRTEAFEKESRQALDAVRRENEKTITEAKKDFKKLCHCLKEEHAQQQRQELEEYEKAKRAVEEENQKKTHDAREEYRKAVDQITKEYEDICAKLREAHRLNMERVKQHNSAVALEVETATLAQKELQRLTLFLDHIRFCGQKIKMGINFHADTPNIFRVVEMQALLEALEKAFPNERPADYPWPDHGCKLTYGKGWTADPPIPPTPRTRSHSPIEDLKRLLKAPSSANIRDAPEKSRSTYRPSSAMSGPARFGSRPVSAQARLQSETPEIKKTSQRPTSANPRLQSGTQPRSRRPGSRQAPKYLPARHAHSSEDVNRNVFRYNWTKKVPRIVTQ